MPCRAAAPVWESCAHSRSQRSPLVHEAASLANGQAAASARRAAPAHPSQCPHAAGARNAAPAAGALATTGRRSALARPRSRSTHGPAVP
eukprot:scaffold4384_cov367-Prasinococcus_capsulatus_cf.AAC.3